MATEDSKATEKYNNSDKLAIALACLAGVMAIILFLVEKTPWVVGGLLPLMIGLCIYPIVHVTKSRFLRTTLLIVAVLATFVFGWKEWPKARLVSQNTSGTSASIDSKPDQDQNKVPSTAESSTAEEKDKPAKPKKYHPKPAPAVPKSADASMQAPASPASSQTQPMSQVCEPGASCAASTGQQGGITAGTYIAGPPPPTFKLETINKNSQEGPDSFRTEYQLDVTTTTPLSLYVRAQAPDIGSKMRMQACLEVLRLGNGFASGNMRDVRSGAGFCEGHASEMTSGRYQIVVFTTKAEDVRLTYQPD